MNNEEDNIVKNINEYFKIPIYYNDEKIELKKNIIDDLELINCVDQSSNPIYTYSFNNDNDISCQINRQIAKYYTTDVNFLKDNQKLLKEYQPFTIGIKAPLPSVKAPLHSVKAPLHSVKATLPSVKYTEHSSNYKNIIDIWNELKIQTGFKEKYYYVDWEMIDFLNRSELFLQIMSIYNLCSPIFSLLIPIIILIIPFFILKMKGISITITDYIDVLKVVAQTNAIGKLFTVDFSQISVQEKLYVFISAAFYLFSIYQNIMVCIRFNNNMKLIHEHFKEIIVYLDSTILSMKNYLSFSNDLLSQREFNENLKIKINTLSSINEKLKSISEYNIFNINKVNEIGHVLKYFYELHSNSEYNDAFFYSLGFNGYIDCLEGLQNNIREKKMNFSIFIKNINKNIFKNSYYACLRDNNPIKNTIKFNKNIIITGPNASGKTTILKSTLINIILTQQFGCGFYERAKFAPFKHIHCYLNIPDTSGRDSLFQAEARRCKEILDIISASKNETHFCAFDELYSGTNPDEAETSATSFMLYLQKYKNVISFLTTHFIKVCKKLDNVESILNSKMVTKLTDNKLIYTYKIEKGISEVKGGINVLTEMNYPREIIENTINFNKVK